jgi:hypothetical protein
MKKCIHVVAIGDYEMEMCKITFPTIKDYAEKIGADFNLISKAVFTGFPPNYERFQIWEAGKDYDWNFNIDADFLIHPDCEDPTTYLNPNMVGALMGFRVDLAFKWSKYFQRDGRNQGVADNFTLTSSLTHDFWEPFTGAYEELKSNCLPDQERRVSEYQVSCNLAKYGLKFSGIIEDRSKIYYINNTTDSIDNPKEVAKKVIEAWSRGEVVSTFGGAHSF